MREDKELSTLRAESYAKGHEDGYAKGYEEAFAELTEGKAYERKMFVRQYVIAKLRQPGPVEHHAKDALRAFDAIEEECG